MQTTETLKSAWLAASKRYFDLRYYRAPDSEVAAAEAEAYAAYRLYAAAVTAIEAPNVA